MNSQHAIPVTEFPDELPEQLGRYRLIRPIGKGGMGVVYEATHIHLHRKVALKVLRRNLVGDPRFLDRFYREIKALGKVLNTDHVILATDGGAEAGIPFLTMEFVEGLNLDQVLKRHGGPLPAAEACEMIRQAALGLDAIHQHGLVHRDLKPTNLMLTPEGVVKILDLGLVRLQADEEDRAELTPTVGILGTLDFQAPEQALDARTVDIRADIYSLGCTFYKLLTGLAPYGNFERFQKIEAHAELPIPVLPGAISAEVRAIVAKMMAKKPAERYQTPLEAAAAVAPFAERTVSIGVFAPGSAVTPANPQALTPVQMTTPVSAASAVAPTMTVNAEATPITAQTAATGTPPRNLAPLWIAVVIALAAVGLTVAAMYRPRDVEPPKPNVKTDELPPAIPAAAAPVRPASLDEFKPLDAHFLLDFEPIAALWKPRDPNASFLYDAKARKLSVTCAAGDKALFHLGNVTASGYELQVRIFQPEWRDGIGVYLGYRALAQPRPLFPKSLKNKDVVIGEFQLLYFQQVEAKDNAGRIFAKLRVDRCKGEHYRKPGGREDVLLSHIDGDDLPPLVNECMLTLVVKNHRLDSVFLDKLPELKNVLAPEVAGQFSKELHQGEAGIYVVGTNAVFRDAAFRILKK